MKTKKIITILNNKKKLNLFFFLLFLTTESLSQYNNFFLGDPTFFGRQTNARTESMGKGYTTIDAGLTSIFYNPAGITTMKGIEIIASHNAPFYLLPDAKYEFIGMGYHFNDYLSIGLSRNYFSTGVDTIIDWSGRFIDTFTPYASIHSFICSSQPLKNLFLGLNTNIFTWHPFNKSVTFYYFDFGLIKEFKLPNDKTNRDKYYFCTSISNLNFAKVPSVPDFFVEENELPVITRYGLNYQYNFYNDLFLDTLNTFKLIVLGEYQWVLNSKYYSGIHTGIEFMLLEIVSLRSGYYNEKINDNGLPEYNKNQLSSFTYGIGIQLPLHKLTKIPLNINFDFTSLPPASYTKIKTKLDNFTTYTFRLNWIMNR